MTALVIPFPLILEPLIQSTWHDLLQLELGSFIHHMGEDHFRSRFMKQEGIPFFVWYLEFGGMLKLYRKEIIQSADAIKTGVAPGLGPKAGLFACMG